MFDFERTPSANLSLLQIIDERVELEQKDAVSINDSGREMLGKRDDLKKQQSTFYVQGNPNPYEAHEDDDQEVCTVNIRQFDVIFYDQVCTLIYMQDLTQFTKEER